MRAIAAACAFVLMCCAAVADEKSADKPERQPVEEVSPKAEPARPCSDVYQLAQESSGKRSDSMDEAAREAMVVSSSPFGRLLHQLSCALTNA